MEEQDAAQVDVLVVEDEALVRMMLCDLLDDAGLSLAEAEDAEAALARLARMPADCPGLLLTDINLGLGPDGVELATRVREERPDLPVLFVTGNPERLAPWGPLGPRERLLTKPFEPAELTRLVFELTRWLREVAPR